MVKNHFRNYCNQYLGESRRKMGSKGNQNKPKFSPSSDLGGSYCELVRTELDAAYALAEFSQLVHRDEEGYFVQQWGAKGRRRRKSYKTCSKVQSSTSQLTLTVKEECHPVFAETPLEIASTWQQESKACTVDKEEPHSKPPNIFHSVQLKNVKFEPMYGTANVEPKLSRIFAYQHRTKLRKPLTEIEKEARRLHRVQANRESARQTIRRKKALHDELSQKAVQLAHENETMKQQTELVMQEYNSLKDRNKQLKEQISSTSRDQALETPADSKVLHVQTLELPSRQTPILCDNGMSLPPFLWATAFIQSSSATQMLTPENKEAAMLMEINPSLTTYRNMVSNFWTYPSGNSQWHAPQFFLPYMLPFYLGVRPSASHLTEPPTIAAVFCTPSECQTRSSTHVREDGDDILVEAKEERMPSSGDVATSNQNEMLQQHSIDEPLQKSITNPTHIFGRVFSQLPLATSSSSTTSSYGKETLLGSLPYDKPVVNNLGPGHSGLQSKEPNPQNFLNTPHMRGNFPSYGQEDSLYVGKRISGAAVASEARKRRKELARSKSIQTRRLKLHC